MAVWKPKDLGAFVHALMASLPLGEIWTRAPASTLVRTVRGLMGIVARWAERAATFLLVEAFPPTSYNMLPDWERVLGLPEECFPAAQTLEERRLHVLEKLRRRPGGQSRAYFTTLAARLGYHETVRSPTELPAELPGSVGRLREFKVTEYRPFMAGVSRCGDPRWMIAPPAMRFVWKVTVPRARITWFRCGGGGGRAGQDPHCRIARAVDLECILHKLKPAHSNLIFSYTGA